VYTSRVVALVCKDWIIDDGLKPAKKSPLEKGPVNACNQHEKINGS